MLYRRCKTLDEDPYDGISLYDLSGNREGYWYNRLSYPKDVLYNLTEDRSKGEFLNEFVLALEIKEISENRTYEKLLIESGVDDKGAPFTHTCLIKLLHDKIPCNYSHCIFQITFNGNVVTKENYKKTFGKDNKAISRLRKKCKVELAEMIFTKELWINKRTRKEKLRFIPQLLKRVFNRFTPISTNEL